MKQYEVLDFNTPVDISTTGYNPDKNSLGNFIEYVPSLGCIRGLIPKVIPYLEQGYGATLAPTVFATTNYLYTPQVTSASVLRVNRWSMVDLTWDGFISLTIAGAGVKTCRDLWVGNNDDEILVGFTSATTLTDGGIAWLYGISSSSWQANTTFPLGTTTVSAGASFIMKSMSNTVNQLQTITSIDRDSFNSNEIGTSASTSASIFVMQSTNTAAAPMFHKYSVSSLPNPIAGVISLSAGSITSGILTGDIATNLPQAAVSQMIYCVPGSGHASSVSGDPSIFFTRGTTTSRLGRIAVSAMTNGFTLESDYMAEVTPRGTTIDLTMGAFSGLNYNPNEGYFYITTNGATRDYRTLYSPGESFDLKFGAVSYESNVIANTDTPMFASHTSVRAGNANGWLIISRQLTGMQQLVLLNSRVHGDSFTTKKITLTNTIKLYRVIINTLDSLTHEPYNAYYRTSGIDDDSGSWTILPSNGDLSGIGTVTQIQLKIVFKILGMTCIPAHISNIIVAYEDNTSTDSHYQPSMAKSSIASRIFAYRQSSAWGSNIPTLNINLYNASTNALVLNDNTVSLSSGTWEYSTDGTNWNSWSVSADTVGNYIRYTANSLPAGIIVRAIVTQ